MLTKGDIFRAARRYLPITLLRPIKKYYVHTSNYIKFGDWNFLHAIAIEVTEHCNRRCYYCPVSVAPKPKREIDWQTFTAAVDRLIELDWNNIVDFTFYNEPLLCENLEAYVGYVARNLPKGIPQIISNGDGLTVERAASLIGAGVQNFLITQHPPYSGRWLTNITRTQAAFPDHIHYKSIEDTNLFNRGGLITPKYQESLKANGCFAATTGLVIDINGNYLYCCCDYNREYVMGNVTTHSILQVRNDPIWKNARVGAQTRRPSLDICTRCYEQKAPPAPTGNKPEHI